MIHVPTKNVATLAIAGGKPIRDMDLTPWPCWPIFGEPERRQLLEVFESGRWWYGARNQEFEQAFAGFQGARFGVACSSGTAALELALLACGIGVGDEVIVPPYTFIATATAVMRVGAIPVFADVQLETANLDPASVEACITRNTRAIVPVHFAGLPVDMDALGALAGRHNLRIVEDACHSWGSQWKGKGTGALGDAGAFSFQLSKNITSGEGGIVLSDDPSVAQAARSYCNLGRTAGGQWYGHDYLGANYRMTEFQAAILLGQLTRLREQDEKRQANALVLDNRLRSIPGLTLPERDPRVTRRSYHLYWFCLSPEVWDVPVRAFVQALMAEGIPVQILYPIPIYRNLLFQRRAMGAKVAPFAGRECDPRLDYTHINCPNAERLCRQLVCLRHQTLLAEQRDMHQIADGVRKIWDNRSQLRSLAMSVQPV